MEAKQKTIKLFEIKKIKTDFESKKILSSEDGFNFIKKFYGDDIDVFESFFILLLNRANNTIGYAKISQGGICGTVVDVKIIAKYVVDSLASGVILAHNHPSGNMKASEEDINMTKKIVGGLKFLDAIVLDHLILCGDDHYFSLADNGLMF